MIIVRSFLYVFAFLCGLGALPMGSPQASAAPQRIENAAQIVFDQNGQSQIVSSNKTVLLLGATAWPTSLKFYRMPSNFDYSDLTCVSTPSVAVHGAPISAAQLASMGEEDGATDHSLGIVLENPMANTNPQLRETAVVQAHASTGQSGNIILTETGPDTGVFAAGFSSTAPSGHAQGCLPVFPAGTRFSISFSGDENAMPSEDAILIDPFGHVFDSVTGLPVNGATVTLINDETGLPAKVYGEDGVTPYPSTVISGQNVTDAAGNLYVMGTGDYRFPLTEPGYYHLKVEPPKGYVAPSLVAPANLPPGPDGPYVISNASYQRRFELFSPEPLEVNIPIDSVPHGTLWLEKTSNLREASPGDLIPYHLKVKNLESAVMRLAVITDTLPAGLKYRRGSTRGSDEPSLSADGRTLTFDLGDQAPGATLDIRYAVDVLPNAPVGTAVNRASVQIFGSPPSPEATASVRINPLLFSDALTIVGRVVEGDCAGGSLKGVAGVRILLEDGTYVVTDRDGLYHFEAVRKGRHVVQMDTNSLTAAHEPITCHDDTRRAGSASSRFVEGDGGSLNRVDFMLRLTGKASEAIEEKLPVRIVPSDIAAGGRTNWLLGQKPGIEWLFPDIDHNPRAPALRVAIKHAPDQRVALSLNGKTTDPLAFDGTDKADGIAVSVWTGLPLIDGDNHLEARVLDTTGQVVATLKRDVHYANTPLNISYVEELSRRIADGKTRPLIAVRVTDRDGKPVRDGTMVPFRLDQPYLAAQLLDMQQDRQLAGLERAETTVRVMGDEGLAFIALQPTLQAGKVHLAFTLKQDKTVRNSEVDAWLEAGQQNWVVVGFGAGTVGFDTLSKNTKRYWLPKKRDLSTDGQLSLYAKGRIKGAWLLTMVYNSDRSYDPESGLMSGIDPDKYYTVYGDGSRQAFDAPTSRKLYLRLERKDAFILMGDFETAMRDTQLMRINRTLNGIKAEYNGKHISATGFAARSDQRFARDEIQGNGLSGPYRLTSDSLIANSDKVTLETRDRFRPEKIIDSQPMTRHIDYDINPDSGTLTFKSPVLSRDENLNPVFIVVDYEVMTGADKRMVAGGRVAAKLMKDRIELGISALRDDAQNKASAMGVDLEARLNDTTKLRAEVASGGKRDAGNNDAYMLEVEHHGTDTDILAYVRHQDEGFGVGQQNFTEQGTHKTGIDAQARLTEKATLTTALWQQESTTTDQSRVVGNLKLEYRREKGSVFFEATGAVDQGMVTTTGTSDRQVSRLLTLGGTQSLFKQKLQLNGQVQLAIGEAKNNQQFPVRHSLQAAYKVSDTVRLIAGHEIAKGQTGEANSSRIGFDLTPWHGAKLATTLNQLQLGENGARSFAQYGLSQSLDVGKHWTIDATLDSSQTLKGAINAEAINPFQPITVGSALNNTQNDDANSSFTAATFGATFRAADWSWNGRLEARRSELTRRQGLSSNLIRSLGGGKTLASAMRLYSIKDREGRRAELASSDISLAWRPLESHWSVLERLELRHNRADAGVIGGNILGVPASMGENQITTRLINNIAVNYRSDLRDGYGIETSLYYGAKQIRGKLADDRYDGFIDTLGFDIRKTLTPRFDVAFALSQQTAHQSKVKALSYGPSLGFSPKKDVWISFGYNVSGYHDPDTNRHTQQGAYVTLRVKFDQSSLRRMF